MLYERTGQHLIQFACAKLVCRHFHGYLNFRQAGIHPLPNLPASFINHSQTKRKDELGAFGDGMKLLGGASVPSSRCHRIKASTPQISSLRNDTLGC